MKDPRTVVYCYKDENRILNKPIRLKGYVI